MQPDLERAALDYAERGLPVFPCAPGAKNPRVAHGPYDASADIALVRSWWRRWPGANIAIPMGPRSGLLAIDVDVKREARGPATLADLQSAYGELPVTLTASTPSGGEHLLFQFPEGGSIRSAAGTVAGEAVAGIDIRGLPAGYVLVAPSVVGGAAYRWTRSIAPVELPARWIAALTPPMATLTPGECPSSRPARGHVEAWCLRALQSEARRLAATPVGERNDRLWRSAAALGGLVHLGAIDSSDVRRALSWACAQWQERSPRKDLATLEGGLEFGLAHPRSVRWRNRDAA